jgi:hypothetical protein
MIDNNIYDGLSFVGFGHRRRCQQNYIKKHTINVTKRKLVLQLVISSVHLNFSSKLALKSPL